MKTLMPLSLLLLFLMFPLHTFISHSQPLFLFFPLTSFMPPLDLALIIDYPSLLFASTVILITSMISIFSIWYMPSSFHPRFFILLFLFVTSMMTLIFSNNMTFTLLGWDGLGMSSYILIIFYQNSSANTSGTITFLSNRIGDITILLSIALLTSSPSLFFQSNNLFPILPSLLIMIAALSKSAQFPFSAWLPAAMAAPTPISALVHSSTLVTAGVFIMYRLIPLHPSSLNIILALASFTMIMSSISALYEQDLKKIIALSTLSQIAIMMFSLGMNLPNLAFFHLITHAVFKSSLFLCAGTLIHNTSYQDMRPQNITFSTNPITSSSLTTTNLALMGLPFLAGFYSKDSIIEMTLISSSNVIPCNLAIIAIGMTSSYSLRLLKLTTSTPLNSPPDLASKEPMFSAPPTIPLSLMAITSGSLLTWMFTSNILAPLPISQKLNPLLLMTLGTILAWSLNYSNKTYKVSGNMALPMWFIHPLSALTFLKTLKKSKIPLITDLTWHEHLSSQLSNKTLLFQTPLTSINTKNTLSLCTMLLMIIMIMSP